MSTHNIQKIEKKYQKIPPFASWPGAMINPQWLEQPISRFEQTISRTNFHGALAVRATKVRLYYFCFIQKNSSFVTVGFICMSDTAAVSLCLVILASSCLLITETCPYNFDPLKPHFYIVKLGFTGYILFFLFLLKNRLWVLVRIASPSGSNEYP